MLASYRANRCVNGRTVNRSADHHVPLVLRPRERCLVLPCTALSPMRWVIYNVKLDNDPISSGFERSMKFMVCGSYYEQGLL